jgi:hypothetical protein
MDRKNHGDAVELTTIVRTSPKRRKPNPSGKRLYRTTSRQLQLQKEVVKVVRLHLVLARKNANQKSVGIAHGEAEATMRSLVTGANTGGRVMVQLIHESHPMIPPHTVAGTRIATDPVVRSTGVAVLATMIATAIPNDPTNEKSLVATRPKRSVGKSARRNERPRIRIVLPMRPTIPKWLLSKRFTSFRYQQILG